MSGAMDREPCPWRIVDDAGGAYAFGAFAIKFIFIGDTDSMYLI